MKEINWNDTINTITMPKQMKENLLGNCLKKKRTKSPLFFRTRLIAATAAIVLLAAASIPSYAAYDLYHTKNIDVFFEAGISQEQIRRIGEELEAMKGIYSIRFVSGEEAWETFANEYLTDELKASFSGNPLANSDSYRVTIKLNANTKEVRNQISNLEGVSKVSNLYESDESKK